MFFIWKSNSDSFIHTSWFINQELLTISFSSLVVVAVAMFIGLKVKDKIPQESYKKVVKIVLFLIACVLVFQTII